VYHSFLQPILATLHQIGKFGRKSIAPIAKQEPKPSDRFIYCGYEDELVVAEYIVIPLASVLVVVSGVSVEGVVVTAAPHGVVAIFAKEEVVVVAATHLVVAGVAIENLNRAIAQANKQYRTKKVAA